MQTADLILNLLTYVSAFILTYFSVFLMLTYLVHKDYIQNYVGKRKWEPTISIIIPMFNAGNEIHTCINSLLKLDYPKHKYEVIIADDCSTDNSFEVVKKYEKYGVKVIQVPKHFGHAAGPKNYGAKIAKGELLTFLDDDSYVEPDILKKMLPYFEEGVGAVTASCRIRDPKTIVEKLQYIEYEVILFLRRILMALESVYVTPGPFSIFTREAFEAVEGFDENSYTEDHEIALHLQAKGYLVRATFDADVQVITPDTVQGWLAQRTRWLRGGLYNRIKHYYLINGFKYGDFGVLAIVLDLILFIPILLMIVGPIVNFFLYDHWIERLGFESVLYSIDGLWFIGMALTATSILWFIHVWLHMGKYKTTYKIEWWIWPIHLFVYSAAWGYVWFFVLWQELTRTKQKWATRELNEEGANAKKA